MNISSTEQAYIFRPFITVKGRRIVRKNGGMFKIPVKDKQQQKLN